MAKMENEKDLNTNETPEQPEKEEKTDAINENPAEKTRSKPKFKKTGKKTEDKLKKELEEKKQELTELKDKYLRLYAEFDNYKKRTIKEKLELMGTASQDILSHLLPVLDDFDRAKQSADDENSTEVFSEGVTLVYEKLYSLLRAKGLEPMVTNGEVFDPEFHEAITEIPAPSEELKGKIVDTIEKGYKLKDKIIRHAKVVIGK
jgi:molecular chaperone GrpE